MLDFVTGSVTGTGADIDVDLGFQPSYVKVINRTQLGTAGNLVGLEWFQGMGDDNALGINAVQDDSSTTTYNLADKTSDGITPIATNSVQTTDPVTVTGFNGFQIPAAFQSDGDELYYIAARS